MTYSIRRAVADDIAQIFRISSAAHLVGYDALIPEDHHADFNKRYEITVENEQKYTDAMGEHLRDSSWYVWVAQHEGVIKGYASAQKIDDSTLRAKELFVDPRYQGEGIGSVLLTTILDSVDTDIVELAVLENNERAKYLYEKNGFVVIGVDSRRPYYGVSRDIMRLIKR
jgi:ribosomal protein S18 acetylase RimI-like enzyme